MVKEMKKEVMQICEGSKKIMLHHNHVVTLAMTIQKLN